MMPLQRRGRRSRSGQSHPRHTASFPHRGRGSAPESVTSRTGRSLNNNKSPTQLGPASTYTPLTGIRNDGSPPSLSERTREYTDQRLSATSTAGKQLFELRVAPHDALNDHTPAPLPPSAEKNHAVAGSLTSATPAPISRRPRPMAPAFRIMSSVAASSRSLV